MKTRFFLFFVLIITFACRKDLEKLTVTEEVPIPPVIKVEGTVAGIVTDEFGSAIAEATVSLGEDQVFSNEQGYFILPNKILNANGTLVTVQKEGYFLGATRIFPAPNSTNYTNFKLLEKKIIGSFSVDDGGTISLPDGANISFQPNSIRNSNGQAHEGLVSVAAKWMNPQRGDLFELMPGNLQGIDEKGIERVLGTYGMIAVELYSEAGELLNLEDNTPALLTMPVPSELLAEAPSEIPLWYFDETDGLWKEEGLAQLQGDTYVGEVSHFSFWNCDAPFPVVKIKGKVVDQNGLGLAGYKVSITILSSANVGYGWTDGAGIFNGKVPSGELLKITVFGDCGEAVNEFEFGPLSEDIDLGTIVVELQATVISGRLLDCDGSPLSLGLVEVILGERLGEIYVADEQGEFSINVLRCNNSPITIRGVDLMNEEWSAIISLEGSGPLVTGDIEVCSDAIVPFFSLSVEDINLIYFETDGWELVDSVLLDSVPQSSSLFTFFWASKPYNDRRASVELGLATVETGTIEGAENLVFNLNLYSGTSGAPPEAYRCGYNCTDFRVIIEQSPLEGQDGFLVGRFEGSVTKFVNWQEVESAVPIGGNFRLFLER